MAKGKHDDGFGVVIPLTNLEYSTAVVSVFSVYRLVTALP